MKQPSQEDLLGYVLGALEAQEQRDFQQQIDDNPQSARIEEQLLEIRASLLPLDYADTSGHRPGLARRTCEFVANFQNNPTSFEHSPNCSAIGSSNFDSSVEHQSQTNDAAHQVDAVFAGAEPVKRESRVRVRVTERMLHPSSWSRMDILACVAMLAVIGSVLLPAISYSRYQGEIVACQNNLRQVGNAMMRYSDCHDGNFVAIPSEGNLSVSGCYAVVLQESGFVDSPSVFSCAGVYVEDSFQLPTRTQVSAAKGLQLENLQRRMGGHFGYTMGVSERSGKSAYRVPRNEGLSHVVLLADMPSNDLQGRKSANHRGNGQNCLFGDGRVEFVSGHTIGEDAIFENDYGIVAPGSHERDNVIAPSHLAPCNISFSR